jgi:hypothetical protein
MIGQRLREAKTNAKQTKEQDRTQEEENAQRHQQPLPEASPQSLTSTLSSISTQTSQNLTEMLPKHPDIAMGDVCAFSQSPLPPSTDENSLVSGADEFFNASLASECSQFTPVTATERSCSSEQGLCPGAFLSTNIPPTDWSPSFYLASPVRQPEIPLTLFAAMYINGRLLGLTCGTVVPAKSSPTGPDVPPSLCPTELQLITIHSIWIDRLPFPKMRDSIISLGGVVEDEEVLRDLILMPSFNIVPGRAPWDPSAWEIQKPFADKWGYLFYR